MRTTTIGLVILAIGGSAIGTHYRHRRALRAAHTGGYILALRHVHRGIITIPEDHQK